MTLAQALTPDTTPTTRARGSGYFAQGAVVHFDPQGSMVYAVVRGSEDYVVRLELTSREIRCTCTCPYFNDRLEPCKHLWAVALTCDARRVLQPIDAIGGRNSLSVVPVSLSDDTEEDWSRDDPEFHVPSPRATPAAARAARAAKPPAWQQALVAIAAHANADRIVRPAPLLGQLLYVIDLAASRQAGTLFVHLLRQEQRQNGEWGLPKAARLAVSQVAGLPETDRTILERLGGARPFSTPTWVGAELASPVHLTGTVARDLLPLMCQTGRCRLALTQIASVRPQDSPVLALDWDENPDFACRLRITRDQDTESYSIVGVISDGRTDIPLSAVHLLLDDGLTIADTKALRAAPGGVMPWMQQLFGRGPLSVPVEHTEHLRDTLVASGATDVSGLPDELRTQLVDAPPIPHLALHSHRDDGRLLRAEVTFSYDGGDPIPAAHVGPLAPTRQPRQMARRIAAAERAAHERFRALGARVSWNSWEGRQLLQVAASDVPRIVRTLIGEGWHVEAEGRQYRLSKTAPEFNIRSRVDWFELRGEATFDDQTVSLPQLLEAVKAQQGTIVLGDGTYGILPEAWLRELAPLAIGGREGDHVRFERAQVALLDAMLAARPAVSWDAAAEAARERLRAFEHIEPMDPPESFVGTLRPYQREGLGWLAFLREFGFGGCLADDMGLGKTVIVLALFDARRHERETSGLPRRPSLVVVPRSVLFNWQQEAARFAPRLRVLDFSGAGRTDRLHHISESDLVLVTYGTLRRDAPALADVEFDYVVLDEAQTIKNANTAGAKAARLLRGAHRLALSGTPVENRLADLWSLFEFLNPGLLSGATAFGRSFGSEENADEIRLLAKGLRPFILRRTKEQVALELPAKTEQTIVCELERPQRALYEELRDHYRRTLLNQGSAWQKSKLHVLEALLRLRQAACHPALVDPKRADDASAKLDLLIPRLVETIEEGHKALVFSQFTSFLSLLRTRLDTRRIAYEYLDGRTKDRQERVERFQSDPTCGLFLISLKAGGVGLNLTAADYVFILDPWWNPAAEAQAVDRTHRIGQTRSVFAYRLIAKDTVEERVLELQQRKRELAEAIITADNSVVRSLTRDDLELLLS
ncbi:MAG: DEAD/DEAH box helicase [Vicinamibacterales bacterium]